MIIRTLVKLVMVAVIVIAAISYLSYLKTGRWVLPDFVKKPDLRVPELKMPKVSMPDALTPAAKPAYKWQDADGAWHYTSEPPASGIPYTRVEPLNVAK